MSDGIRLDVYLYISGLARSRTHAANLVKLGKVKVNGTAAAKTSCEIYPNSIVEVSKEDDYVSLGGLKLDKAINYFKLCITGKTAIDIGAANGGFTDVLLKRGASKVYAVDVGDCALPQELVLDSRVEVKDRLNARYLAFEDIGIKADIITVDVSFISLKLIIPALLQFLKPCSVMVMLIKPQFEAGRNALTKSGIITCKKTADKVVRDVSDFCTAAGLSVLGVTEAPRPFADKNQEYLICCTKE